jgi:hypothetical protein
VNQIFSGQYYADDKYADDHPVFNRSVVAITRIIMNESMMVIHYCLFVCLFVSSFLTFFLSLFFFGFEQLLIFFS